MRLYVHHRTVYRFTEPQARIVQLLRLTPGSHIGQNVLDWRIDVDCDVRLKRGRDGYGNETTMLYVTGPTDTVALTVTGEVITDDRAGAVTGAIETLPHAYFLQGTALTAADPAIVALAESVAAKGLDPLPAAHALRTQVHEAMRFDSQRPVTDRDAATALADGHGIGQDHAHVLIAAARAIGIPARYVAGHRYHSDDARDDAPHGWAELHVPEYGWIGFDAATDRCPDDAYIRIATGLDFREAAPVSGARIGGGHEMLDIGVKVGLSQRQVQS